MSRTLMVACFLVVGSLAAQAAPQRVEIEGLVTAAPVPEGYALARRDLQEGGETKAHMLLVGRDGSPTRASVLIERREVKTRPAQIATLKAYVNAAAATWQQQGWTVKSRTVLTLERVDFAQPVVVELVATKEGQPPMMIHLKVMFEQFPCSVMTLSSDEGQLKQMLEWSQTVRPIPGAPATRPAK